MTHKINYNQEYFLNKYITNAKNIKNGKRELKISENSKYDFIANVNRILEENNKPRLNEEIAPNINVDTEACSTKTINKTAKVIENPTKIHNCSEKSTYCRPITDYYNQQFIFKTMSRNARLQRLLNNIIISRQNERQEDAWKHFINDLKHKHGVIGRDEVTNQNMPEEYPEVYDWYNTRYRWDTSQPCQNLLEDFYGRPQTYTQLRRPEDGPIFERRHYCYPTSSQGRFIVMNRDKAKSFGQGQKPYSFRGNTIVIDKNVGTAWLNRHEYAKHKKDKSTTAQDITSSNSMYKSTSVQANIIVPHNDHSNKPIKPHRQQLLQSAENSYQNDKNQTLMHIEDKLNELINTINKLMTEINTKNITYNRSTSVSFKSNNVSTTRSDQFGITNTESLIRGISSYSDVGMSKALESNIGSTRLNKILTEEIDKSNKIKKDIDDILNGRSHSSSLDVNEEPTKDMCTEIVRSVRTSGRKYKKSLAAAMNTDPVGLLGLLKISKETITQILSYMPRIDYYSFLSMVQFPQLSKIESDYTCNICGAAFCRPSRLNEHIQKHNLDNTRNCCVCRHIVDSKRRSALFRCRYCHQQFTRAYCCELHQRSCAKNFGLRHEESSNLVMLS